MAVHARALYGTVNILNAGLSSLYFVCHKQAKISPRTKAPYLLIQAHATIFQLNYQDGNFDSENTIRCVRYSTDYFLLRTGEK